jgi:hypothetical protein
MLVVWKEGRGDGSRHSDRSGAALTASALHSYLKRL